MTNAEKLILELAALERDSNDEFGDVLIDGTTDLFDRIQECAWDIQARQARDEFRNVTTTTPTEDFPGGVSAGDF
jgi:hypothetical protein